MLCFLNIRLDGEWPDGLLASDNTLHFVHPLTFNYSGVYVCKVTNSLGQRSDQKVIYISGKPLPFSEIKVVIS